ncbi:bifunctional diaminohydroxyphosphoribosylaminopyrimidine deaminase/5-amino-6-(5-phosphoribosylamino)uracil reductase RibD [Utexia brackfieldae]|uniref:bifunctional diaminohydroxyphosphoribosylaminopyrimidine deaminase/5-amino-6-(5-phosphoribosylamino)uracil reductase RibD n=1 Tax=Utexia brackfieldae TaxID=3074108 RepID=UPI00370CFCD5
MFESDDIGYMQRAIMLAKRGIYTTTPNPNVGCVIVQHGNIVGEGFHYQAGLPHAEVYALDMAGQQAKGATAYVTLEPCSHHGKTPPCADALIRAGIARVVIAMLDPNPLVAGQGVARLMSAGIAVESGLLAEQAEEINRGFLKRMRTGLPYVRLKMAASLDGRTAMASGESKWITSALSRQDVQQFRAQSSAILSSSATILADDPSLTVRWSELADEVKQNYPQTEVRQPIRVVLDSQHRLTLQEQVFKQPGCTWLVRKIGAKLPADVAPQIELLIDDATTGPQVDLQYLLQRLGQKQINTLWVEAGATLAGALIAQDLVDELIIYMAPKILGDKARALCMIPELMTLSQVPQFQFSDITSIGSDIRMILKK